MLRGFTAFDLFLEQHPEFRERVTFIAQLMPSRTDVPEYAEYLERIEALVAVVNHRHGTPDWMPIQLKLRDDLEEAVAAYKHYDVLLVNAMFDGMNLVAKEGPLVNERDGVSILSENTGAHEELGEYALSVNPFDIQELADSIHAALTMAAGRARAAARAGSRRSSPRATRATGSTSSSRDIREKAAQTAAERRSRSAAQGEVRAAVRRAAVLRRHGEGFAGCGGRHGAAIGDGRGRPAAPAARAASARGATSLAASGRAARPVRRAAAPSRGAVRVALRALARPRRAAPPPLADAAARVAAPSLRAARRAPSAPPRPPPARATAAARPGSSPPARAGARPRDRCGRHGHAAAGGSRGARPPGAATRRPRARARRARRAGPRCPSGSCATRRRGPSRLLGGRRRGFAPCYLPPPPSIVGELPMAAPEPLYDLVLLLDTSAPEDQRKKILADAEARDLAAAARSSATHDWGTRALAYEIRHRTDAEYHLLQFHGPRELLAQPAAHAADHRRRPSLPHHQARAGHARPDRAAARRGAGRAPPAPAAERPPAPRRTPPRQSPPKHLPRPSRRGPQRLRGRLCNESAEKRALRAGSLRGRV